MNTFQQKLWDDLMALVAETDSPFYFKDFAHDDGTIYRIFNYRLSSYSDFLKPSAMECRGVMFEVEGNGCFPVRLASLPMPKFFNLHENPMTMNLDLSLENIDGVTFKADGSLISTYKHTSKKDLTVPYLSVKSKGSISSDQVVAARKLIERMVFGTEIEFQFVRELMQLSIDQDYTVNMDYVAPTNRIVIGYEKPQLIVLSVRDNINGRMHYKNSKMLIDYPAIQQHWVEEHVPADENFVESIPDQQGIEGYVVRLKDGTTFKAKTTWYMALHHTKDSINSPRRLFECVINETTDDLRAMFYDDPVAIQMIDEMEKRVDPIFNHMMATVETFYTYNKELSRKDYAIKGQQIADGLFGLKMNKYLNKPVDYKEFAIKHPEMFGVKSTDEQSNENQE